MYKGNLYTVCNKCGMCERVCQRRMDITGSLEALVKLDEGKNWKEVRAELIDSAGGKGRSCPDNCAHCGACEDMCPQGLPIRDMLEKAAYDLGL